MKRLAILVFAAIAALSLITAYAALGNTSKSDANSPAAAAPAAAHFDAEKATDKWMATLSPEARARSDAYFEGGYWLILWDFVVGLLVAWLLLGTKLSARMRNLSMRITRFTWVQTGIYAIQYIILTTVITLPWALYEGYFREHHYGMSNQDIGAFMGDQVKGLAIALIFGTLAIMAIYAVVRNAPKTWWLWGSLVAFAFLVFSVAIGPTYLEPVFNKFYPLPDSPLKQQILSLARANQIPATDVYEFDASKQTTKMSAHVSGLFNTVQISMNDNLMNRGSPEEIKAVLGHEMGHYVMNHVYKGMVFIGIIIIVGFAFLRWSYGALQARYRGRWGIGPISDVAGLPLVIALLGVYGFVITPVNNTLTRTMEAEADAFGLNAARQPDGFAQAAIHLSEYRKMQPGTLEEILFYDHPSGWHRIHRAMVWKAEHINDCDIVAYDAAHPVIAMPPEPTPAAQK